MLASDSMRCICTVTALERVLEQTAGKFCVGDELTVADLALVPQFMNATRFTLSLSVSVSLSLSLSLSLSVLISVVFSVMPAAAAATGGTHQNHRIASYASGCVVKCRTCNREVTGYRFESRPGLLCAKVYSAFHPSGR